MRRFEMRTSFPALLLAAAVHRASARSWLDVANPSQLTSRDRFRNNKSIVLEVDAQTAKFTTEAPTISPMPTAAPTQAPTAHPTQSPTRSPTTKSPTTSPTFSPTSSPTEDIWDWHVETPKDPDKGYFNYNPNSKYGPGKWDDLKWADDTVEAKYWDDYSRWIDPGLNNNKCDSDSGKQSPINVNADDVRGECLQYHEFRHKPGKYGLDDSQVKLRIHPSKLRLEFPSDVGNYDSEGKHKFDNPSADAPKGWGDNLPVTHVDIKIPSEHHFEGKQFAAEYQIFLIQNRDNVQRGAPVVSILIDLDEDDKPNQYLQRLLDAFQVEWDADMAECENGRRRERRLDGIAYRKLQSWLSGENREIVDEGEGISTWADEPKDEEAKFQQLRGQLKKRRLQDRRWNPWNPEIYRSIWFYGYEGSMTEPPCTEFMEWHIIDTPAKISRAQLYQMKNILFNHVDSKCRKTSVHFHGSVARPLQKMEKRDLYRCTCDNFLSDYTVVQEGRKNCGMKLEQAKDTAKKMGKNDRDEKPWAVDNENYPGNWSDEKKWDYPGFLYNGGDN